MAIIIVPARLESTRLQRKLLLDNTGFPLIVHTITNLKNIKKSNSSIDDIYVATDSTEIRDIVEKHGIKAVMTRPDHISGTDRIKEASDILHIDVDDIIVNVQADEPSITGDEIKVLIDRYDSSAHIGTLCTDISQQSASIPNVVKVVLSDANHALYFSRHMIPWGGDSDTIYKQHIGVYSYLKGILDSITSLPHNYCEKLEKLEQLRWLSGGYKIVAHTVNHKSRGIDTLNDYIDFAVDYKLRNTRK